MSAGSVSKIEIIVEIKGKSQLRCELKRHLAPVTVGAIVRSLPLEGNAHMMNNSFVYIETKINVGGERQRKEFKKGEMAFMTEIDDFDFWSFFSPFFEEPSFFAASAC